MRPAEELLSYIQEPIHPDVRMATLDLLDALCERDLVDCKDGARCMADDEEGSIYVMWNSWPCCTTVACIIGFDGFTLERVFENDDRSLDQTILPLHASVNTVCDSVEKLLYLEPLHSDR